MVVEQTMQARLDELNRCKDLARSTIADQNWNGSANGVVSVKNETIPTKFEIQPPYSYCIDDVIFRAEK